MSSFERSKYATPVGDLRSEEQNISIGEQRISRDERANLRYIRNAERQALAFSNSTESNRRIKEAADKARNEIINRSNSERGKLVEGILYDSMQYDPPTNNKQGVDSVSTSSESGSTDSISSDAAPGNSTGSAAGGVPNDNVTTDPEITPDTPVTILNPLRPIDWYNYDTETQDLNFGVLTRGSIDIFQIVYDTLKFRSTGATKGFQIQTPTGVNAIDIDINDLGDTATEAEPAKFREIKVCFNGVPATMFVLGTKPVAS
jgi:hypothetical protein|tara:strand:+ start:950 stop:1729 length:780 start_codon:yes stop_codon:yes gene_type:complete